MFPNKAVYKGGSVVHSSLSSGANYSAINQQADPGPASPTGTRQEPGSIKVDLD